MDFLFGPQNIDKTTCLIHLADQFIINNKIKSNNGYILLFTPPNSPVQANNTKTQNKVYQSSEKGVGSSDQKN